VATFPAAANAYLAETTTSARRSASLGRLQASFLAATDAGQVYVTAVATVVGWRGTCPSEAWISPSRPGGPLLVAVIGRRGARAAGGRPPAEGSLHGTAITMR